MTAAKSNPTASALGAPTCHASVTSAYIHVPFCQHRCAYCNFTVVADRADLEQAYLDALEIELSWLKTPPVKTLFVGGGTPTELSPGGLQRLCELLDRWHPRWPDHEATFEANPESLNQACVDILVGHGINRLSLGVQSFSPHKLKSLDRRHSTEDVTRALSLARSAFPTVSLDLIFAAPGESLVTWHDDLDMALASHVNHLSTYGLTIEQGTLFWNRRQKGHLSEIDDAMQRAMYEMAIDRLTTAGWEHYEVSNFARPGYRCRHNETYWLGNAYYAAGPGAARYVNHRRESNHRSTTTYIRHVLNGQSPVVESEFVGPEDQAREKLIFGLRRLEGIQLSEFAATTGYRVEALIGGCLPGFIDRQLLEVVAGRLRLTRQGLLVSDSLWPAFL